MMSSIRFVYIEDLSNMLSRFLMSKLAIRYGLDILMSIIELV